MSEMGSVTRLLARIRNGDRREIDPAATEIWNRYFPELLRVANQHLSPKIRVRADGEDIALDALDAFFRRYEKGQFDLANRDEFWLLLFTITRNKARKAANKEQADRRDVNREQAPAAAEDQLPSWLTDRPDESTPTPADAAEAADQCQLLLGMLEPKLRQVAVLKFEGYTHKEIAEKLGCSVRTVERRVEDIRTVWGSTCPDDE